MKTIVVYTSKTGFTEKYANWIGQKLNAALMTLDEAKKAKETVFDEADAIIYGGWVKAGKIVGAEWFTQRIDSWKGKKLAVFAVGGCPNDVPDIEETLKNILTDEQRNYAKAFYCQGGMNYDRMKLPARLAMKLFASMVSKKKDKTEADEKMAEMMAQSYDISDEKYTEPIVSYVNVLR